MYFESFALLIMQAVILAAGLGTRMGDLTRDKPKPLLTIENKTLLEHLFSSLPDAIDEVVLVVGYLKEQIRSLIGENHAGRKIVYVEQKELKGTAHALAMCKNVLRGKFLVLMGDDLYRKEDLSKMIKFPLALLAWELPEVDRQNDFQAIVKVNSQGNLVNIIERQPAVAGALVNCGAYVLDERYFDLPLVPAGNKTAEFGLPQTFLQLVRQGAKIDIVKASWWYKVSAPEDLKSVNSG